MIDTKEKSNVGKHSEKMHTKFHYLQQSGLPENFSLEKLDRILNMLYPVLDDVDYISEYIRLLEKLNVLLYKDNCSALLFLRPINSLVEQYIKNCLSENNINADETIINEIVNDGNTNNSNIINLRVLKK